MIELLFQALATGLSIWNDAQKHKYVDRLMALRQEYYAESNKALPERSDAVLDNLEFELRNLTAGFAAAASKPDIAVK